MLKIWHVYKHQIDNKVYLVIDSLLENNIKSYKFLRWDEDNPFLIEHYAFNHNTWMYHLNDITPTYIMPVWFELLVNLPMNYEE